MAQVAAGEYGIKKFNIEVTLKYVMPILTQEAGQPGQCQVRHRRRPVRWEQQVYFHIESDEIVTAVARAR